MDASILAATVVVSVSIWLIIAVLLTGCVRVSTVVLVLTVGRLIAARVSSRLAESAVASVAVRFRRTGLSASALFVATLSACLFILWLRTAEVSVVVVALLVVASDVNRISLITTPSLLPRLIDLVS